MASQSQQMLDILASNPKSSYRIENALSDKRKFTEFSQILPVHEIIEDDSSPRTSPSIGPTISVAESQRIVSSRKTCASSVTLEQIQTKFLTRRRRPPMSREARLEQNRKAARESRKRKKVMVDELQRSVVFLSQANASLKNAVDQKYKLLAEAHKIVSGLELYNTTNGNLLTLEGRHSSTQKSSPGITANQPSDIADNGNQAVRSKIDNNMGSTISEARPFHVSGENRTIGPSLSSLMIDSGGTSTMDAAAMGNFQQAAIAAMQAVIHVLKHSPGLDTDTLVGSHLVGNLQQTVQAALASFTTGIVEPTSNNQPSCIPMQQEGRSLAVPSTVDGVESISEV